MKIVAILLLPALLAGSSGCITYSAVQEAKGQYNAVTGHQPDKPYPGCYALLPLTGPADVATALFQLMAYLALYLTVQITGDGP